MARKREKGSGVIQSTESVLARVWGLIAWLTGILVSLAVASGMISGTLYIASVPLFITQTAGWIVVILTILGVSLAAIDKLLD